MSITPERTLNVLELLAENAEGLSLTMIATKLNMPKSGVHRLLKDLIRLGYLQQKHEFGDYSLTIKLVTMGLSYFHATGLVDLAQPILDNLATKSGELIRLSIIDNENLKWLAKAQGAKYGLRYDPDMVRDVQLSCTSSGFAWLMTYSDEKALMMAAKQGFGHPDEFGKNAPTTPESFLKHIRDSRLRGYGLGIETHTPGIAAIAVPIMNKTTAIGVLSLSGPVYRLPPHRLDELAQDLKRAAKILARSGHLTSLFKKP